VVAVSFYRRRTSIAEIPKPIVVDTAVQTDFKPLKRARTWGSERRDSKTRRKNEEKEEKRIEGVKASIGRPMPKRPASAEPLGRLSGMGMGLGYMK
jgi:hypothetical protein